MFWQDKIGQLAKVDGPVVKKWIQMMKTRWSFVKFNNRKYRNWTVLMKDRESSENERSFRT